MYIIDCMLLSFGLNSCNNIMFKANSNNTYLTLARFLYAIIISLPYSNFRMSASLGNEQSRLAHALCKQYFKSLCGQSSIYALYKRLLSTKGFVTD